MKHRPYRCHKCGRFVGPAGYRDEWGESSICAKHLAEFAAKLDHCADVFFGEQQRGANETPRPDDQTA
jgi:hypothetical protein